MSPFVGGRWKKTCNIFKFVEKIRFRKDDQIIALNTFGIRNEQHLRCTWSRRIFSLLSLCLRNDALIETLSHLIYEERKIESFDDIFGFHAECNLKVNNRAIIHSPAAGSAGSTDKMLIWNIHNLDRCQLLDAHPFNYYWRRSVLEYVFSLECILLWSDSFQRYTRQRRKPLRKNGALADMRWTQRS